MSSQQFIIKGFHCDACVKLTTSRLQKIIGVQYVAIEPDGMAEVLADRKVTIKEVRDALRGTDYVVTQSSE